MTTETNTSAESEIAVDQAEFDRTYITASELMRELNITRAGFLYGRRSGKLPRPIVVNEGRLMIWKRQEVQPLLDNWKQARQAEKQAA